MYIVELAKKAGKELKALPEKEQTRVAKAIRDLAKNPRPEGVRKVQGEDNIYRIRVGDYRVIYHIEDRKLYVLIVRVRHRKDAYR